MNQPPPPRFRPHPGHLYHLVSPTLALLAVLAAPPTTGAQFDDFNDGNDTGWTRYTPLKQFGAGATYTFPGGTYQIAAPASPSPDLFGPQRAGALRAEQSYTRVRVATDIRDWNNSVNQSLGLIARVNQVGLGTLDAYTYNYNTRSGYHQLTYVLDERPVNQVNESPFPLDPTQVYRMVFTLVGDRLLGQTYSATNSEVPVHSLFGVNDTHVSGTAGVFAFALTLTDPILARFDNYAAVVPDKVRATMLDATPAVGEQPAEAIAVLVIRLANLETTLQTDTIQLQVDGQAAAFDLSDEAQIYSLVHTPAAPLDPKVPHTARLTFADEDGPQTFAWPFGAPVAVQPATLLGAATLGESFQTEAAAVLDAPAKTFTVPLTGSQRFFQVSDSAARRITRIERVATGLLIGFE